ncbi:hypothetical protein H0H93_008803 [Arthromyces matolae]|nr:hypothetical protein H0H93_008803 [Arthromyces matolae]
MSANDYYGNKQNYGPPQGPPGQGYYPPQGPPPGQGGYYPQQPPASYQQGYPQQGYPQQGYQPQPQPQTVYVHLTKAVEIQVVWLAWLACVYAAVQRNFANACSKL